MKFRNVAFASTAAVIAAVAIGSGAAQATSLITGKDVKDGSIHRIDLGDGINARLDKTGTPGFQGPAGKDGAQGPAGKDGAQGPAGKDGHVNTYVQYGDFVIPQGGNAQLRLPCNAGDVVTGGGYSTNDHNAHYGVLYQNRPDWINVNSGAPDGWIVQGYGGDQDSKVAVWAICTAA